MCTGFCPHPRYTFISAMYFAAIFIAVETVFGVIRIEFTFLIKFNYFWCMLLGWISLTFIYLFMGCLYLVFSVLLSAGLVALGASFLVSLIFMALSFYNSVPTVYLVMDVMQWPAMKEMGMRGMDIMFVIKPLIYNAIAMVALAPGRVRVRLDLAYDGAGFNGWAAQPGLRTVEGELGRALAAVVRHPVRLTVAGRTDAGVHASGRRQADGLAQNLHHFPALAADQTV